MVRDDRAFDQVVKEAESSLKPVALPVDYKMEFTGEELKRKESMSNLTFALILSLVLVFMVLAAQFESIIQPFVIMLTIPLAGVGTVLTFILLGKPLNMMAYIGIIMLGGIAVNNAIILIDRVNQLREDGKEQKRCNSTCRFPAYQADPYDKPYNNSCPSAADDWHRRKRLTQSSNGSCGNWRTGILNTADAYCDTMCLLGF